MSSRQPVWLCTNTVANILKVNRLRPGTCIVEPRRFLGRFTPQSRLLARAVWASDNGSSSESTTISSAASRGAGVEKSHVGPFELIKKLGRRQNKVYLARQTEQDREVTIKFIAIPKRIRRDVALEKLQAEFAHLRTLKHPNLVRVFGAGVDDDRLFIASEYVVGDSLAAQIGRMGRLSLDQVIDIGIQVARCLHYLHEQNLLHCKLTPEKILIDDAGQVKVSDLRLNRSKKKGGSHSVQRDLELIAYLAPEHLEGEPSPKSDLYSLGVILYEMLTGALPYPPDTVSRTIKHKKEADVPSVTSVVMHCPVWIDNLVKQLLQPNPKLRPHSALAVMKALEEVRAIESRQQAAVDQIAGNFNPLNAQADRDEARRLLKRPVAKADQSQDPFWLRWWLPLTALAVAAVVLLWVLWPASPHRVLQESQAALVAEDAEIWRKALSRLAPLLDSGDNDVVFQAKNLITELRRRMLRQQAASGEKNSLQSPVTQEYIAAVQLLKNKQFEQARVIFGRIVNDTPETSDDLPVKLEAQDREMEIAALLRLPDGSADLVRLIDETARSVEQTGNARLGRVLHDVVTRYDGQPAYRRVVEKAREAIEKFKIPTE